MQSFIMESAFQISLCKKIKMSCALPFMCKKVNIFLDLDKDE